MWAFCCEWSAELRVGLLMGRAFGFCMACMSGCDVVRFDFVKLQYFVCIAFVGPGVEQGVEPVIELAEDA